MNNSLDIKDYFVFLIYFLFVLFMAYESITGKIKNSQF